MSIAQKIIVALDFNNETQALEMVDAIGGELKFVKIGMELYYSCGPQIVEKLKKKNLNLFLDLKLHDIPTTVCKSLKFINQLGVDMVNVHAAGGIEMMKAASEAISDDMLLIAVTQLTSTSPQMLHDELLINKDIFETVVKYAHNAQSAGVNGVVASPIEVPLIHKTCGQGFITVTPGIRPKDTAINDQKRSLTPAEAIANGSDFLVVGRPITKSSNPALAFESILKEIQNA